MLLYIMYISCMLIFIIKYDSRLFVSRFDNLSQKSDKPDWFGQVATTLHIIYRFLNKVVLNDVVMYTAIKLSESLMCNADGLDEMLVEFDKYM